MNPIRRLTFLGGWYLLLAGISLGLGYILLHVKWLITIDTNGYKALFGTPPWHFIALLARPFDYNLFFHVPAVPEDLPTFFYFLILAVAVYLWVQRREQFWWFLLTVALGNIFVHFITFLDYHLVFRVRPFLTLHESIDPFSYNAWKNLSSYPSGHVRDTALYSTITSLYLPKLKIPAVLLVLFIMYSRVYLGAHYPFDVLGGLLIGWGTGYVVWQAVQVLRELRKLRVSAQLP